MTRSDDSNKTSEQLLNELKELRRQNNELEQVLQESEKRLADTQRVGKIGSFVFDTTTGYWSGTDMLYPILGIEEKRKYSVEEWIDIIHPDYRDILADYQLTILEQKIPFDADYLIVRQTDGETRWVNSHGELQFDDKGNVIGMIGTTRDITESKLAEYELIDAKNNLEKLVAERTEELKTSNEQLEAFNYSVSHDLRSPLRSIDGFSCMILEDCGGSLTEDCLENFQRIRKATERMGNLIDDLLRLSNISRLKMHIQEIQLDQIAREIIEPIQDSDPIRKTDIQIHSDLTTKADPGLAWIVLENLISNAWKYSSHSPLTYIEIGECPDKPNTFFIRDKGVGFNMKHASRLFTSFQRLHNTSEFEGTGIGLAIVKRIIDRHKGSIYVESIPDEGSTFFFSFCS